MLLKLAWRNIWRNKRRTFITIGSVFFAVILASTMSSVQKGTYDNMIDSMVGSFNGYIQIHQKGYFESQSINDAYSISNDITDKIKSNTEVTEVIHRIESFALTSSVDVSKGSLIIGIEPEKEDRIHDLSSKISDGEYFKKDDKTVIVGQGLADYFKVGVGDTLILFGQGYHGASAAGKYKISGSIKFGSPELSRQVVFLPLKEAQWYLNAPDLATTMCVSIKNSKNSKLIASQLEKAIGEEFEVLDWHTTNPDVQKLIESDKQGANVFKFILYMVISFGMFGTILMMLAERIHEFGVLIAVGMKKMKIAITVWIEIIIMSLIGAFTGIIGAFPLSLYLYLNPVRINSGKSEMLEDYGVEPVIKGSIEFDVFFEHALIVFIVACIIAIYPLYKINKLKVLEAMRS